MRALIPILLLAAAAAPAAAQDSHAAPAGPAAARSPISPTGEIGRRIAAAAEGDTVVIGPGVYRERIRIDRAIHLIGRGNPVIDGGGTGDIVEITAPGVVLRGFTIRNTGTDLDTENAAIRVLAAEALIESNTLEDILFGIDLREAPASVVRGNTIGGKDLDIARRGDGIRLWRSDGALIENNTIHDGRDAILWYSSNVTVRGNRSDRCRYGLHLMYSDNVVLENNHLEANSVGIYLMYSKGVLLRANRLLKNRGPSGYGIGLKETDSFIIEDNLIAANRVGVYLDGSPFSAGSPGEHGLITRNVLAHNDIGLTFLPSVRGNMLTENSFIDNIEQVCVSGRGELRGNQFWKGDGDDGRGNFWSDYVGYDENRDGVGDFVHESQTLFENLLDREPKLRILLFSPAQQAVEFVGRALPAVRPEPKFIDEVPLMSPAAASPAGPAPQPPTSAMALAGGTLLALGSVVLLLAGAHPGAHTLGPRRTRRPAPGAQS